MSSSASIATDDIGRTSSTGPLHELGDLTHFSSLLLLKAEHLRGDARPHFAVFTTCSN